MSIFTHSWVKTVQNGAHSNTLVSTITKGLLNKQ